MCFSKKIHTVSAKSIHCITYTYSEEICLSCDTSSAVEYTVELNLWKSVLPTAVLTPPFAGDSGPSRC